MTTDALAKELRATLQKANKAGDHSRDRYEDAVRHWLFDRAEEIADMLERGEKARGLSHRIMNLPSHTTSKPLSAVSSIERAYQLGHRDARHAAAELATEVEP